MVKPIGAVTPPEVVTVTLLVPGVALPAIANVAVICVPLTTLMLLTVMPAPALMVVAPLMKFEPVRVTGTLAPTWPPFGLMAVSVGGGGLIVKFAGALVPLMLVTV